MRLKSSFSLGSSLASEFVAEPKSISGPKATWLNADLRLLLTGSFDLKVRASNLQTVVQLKQATHLVASMREFLASMQLALQIRAHCPQLVHLV